MILLEFHLKVIQKSWKVMKSLINVRENKEKSPGWGAKDRIKSPKFHINFTGINRNFT